MDIEKYFSGVKFDTENLEILEAIIEATNMYYATKSNCNIEELQGMDILDESKKKDNTATLKKVEEFLGGPTEQIERISRNILNGRETPYRESVGEERPVSERINVDLSNINTEVYTLLDLTFKANKLTKWLGEKAFDIICTKEGEAINKNISEERKSIIRRLKGVSKLEGFSDKKHDSIIEETIEDIVNTVDGKIIEDWLPSTNNPNTSHKEGIRNLYNKLLPFFETQTMLYEIKNQCLKNLFILLVNDKGENFTRWGFSKDEHGHLVFNVDAPKYVQRDAFHIPGKEKIFSRIQIDILETEGIMEYDGTLDATERKNDNNQIRKISEKDVESYLSKYNEGSSNVNLLKDNEIIIKLLIDDCLVNPNIVTIKQLVGSKSIENPLIDKLSSIIGEQKVHQLKSIKSSNISISDMQREKMLQSQISRYHEELKSKVEDCLMKTKRIYTQKSDKLDKNAAVAALIKHITEKCVKENRGKPESEKVEIPKIEVIEINAGEPPKEPGVYVDCGTHSGTRAIRKGKQDNSIIVINANSRLGERSSVRALSKMGICVPEKILKYADLVYDNDNCHQIFDARNGIYLSRFLKGSYLFAFAEAKKDGKYLIESSLTDEDIENIQSYIDEASLKDIAYEYKISGGKGKLETAIKENISNVLLKESEKKKEAITKDTENIVNNTYTFKINGQEKKVCIVDKVLNCGSWASYALGCDYYISISQARETKKGTDKNSTATVAILSNPKKENFFPDSVKSWAEELRVKKENGEFIVETKNDKDINVHIRPNMIIIGGYSAPDLYLKVKGTDMASEVLKQTLIQSFGAEKDDLKLAIQTTNDVVSNWGQDKQMVKKAQETEQMIEKAQETVFEVLTCIEAKMIERKNANAVTSDIVNLPEFGTVSYSDVCDEGKVLMSMARNINQPSKDNNEKGI